MDYKIFNNFLDNDINKNILSMMMELKWMDGGIRSRSKDDNIRTSKVHFSLKEEFKQVIINTISKELPHIKGYEFQLTMNSDGDFYVAHPDTDKTIKDSIIAKRKWTLVYYVFNEPKPFLGGDILIYDKHETEKYDTNNYTRITPQNNMAVLFPSEYWHEVTTIKNDKKMMNNRFTINTWLN